MCFHFKQFKSKEAFKANDLKGRPVKGIYNGFRHPFINVVTQKVQKTYSTLCGG